MNLKRTAVAFGLLVSSFALAQTVKLERTYKLGETDRYATKMVASLPAMGDVTITFTSEQKVVKLHADGGADIESKTSGMKITIGGNEMPSPAEEAAKPVTQKYDKFGNPVGKPSGQATGMMDQMNFSRYASIFGPGGLEVGKEVPIDVKNEKTKKQEVLGTAKLESVVDNVAKVLSNLKIFSAESDKPMTVDLTTLLDTVVAKVNSVKGTVTGLPDQQGMSIEKVIFEMTRLK